MGRVVWCGILMALLITAAHGQQWVPQNSGSTSPLYGMTFANERCGWAVGGSNPGTVFHTTNGGTEWVAQSVATPFSGPAYAVACTDTLNAWLSGGNFVTFATIQHTTDAGDTWAAQTSGQGSTMKAIVFVDAVNGWAAGGGTTTGTILHTTDGGATWDSQLSGAEHTFIGLDFGNDHTGWAVGRGGEIYNTSDAGTTWNPQTSDITSDLYHVDFKDSLTGWAVGAHGVILNTTNGGQIWNDQNSGTSASIWSVTAAGSDVWAVGDSGIILSSRDDGETWVRQNSGVTTLITAVCFPVPWAGWATMQNGTILHYTGDTTHTNNPPGPFNRLLPVDNDTVVVSYSVGDSVRFVWSTSHDPDGDPVTYILRLDSVHFNIPDTYSTSDTSLYIHFPLPVNRLDAFFSIRWSVTSTDGLDSTTATNGQGDFVLDDQPDVAGQHLVFAVADFLLGSYPNPFNPSTTLRFGVPRASHVSLDVFDLLGRKTAILFSGMIASGEHEVTWNCPTCPSGMYIVRLQAGGQMMQQKVMLLK